MSSQTDTAIAILLAIFLYRGWKIGVFRSLIGPICFSIFFIIGVVILDVTENIIKSLYVILVGYMISSMSIHLMIAIGRTSVGKDFRDYVFLGSRILGSMVSVVWRGIITLIIILFVLVIPSEYPGVEKIQNDIKNSKSYIVANFYVVNRIPVVKNIYLTISLLANPHQDEELTQTAEYQRFFSHPKVVSVMTDDEVTKMLQNKNFKAVLNHPKINAILNDKEVMTHLTLLGKKIYQSQEKK